MHFGRQNYFSMKEQQKLMNISDRDFRHCRCSAASRLSFISLPVSSHLLDAVIVFLIQVKHMIKAFNVNVVRKRP